MKKTLSLALLFFVLLSVNVWAAGVATQPTICDRTGWSARAPQCSITVEPALTRAVIHHTAGSADYNTTSLAESQAKVRAIQNYHMDTNGWCDIGYNFLTDKLGNNFEGRYGSMTQYSRGAHDGVNTQSFGFNMMGYYHTPYNNVPTCEGRAAMYKLIAWRMPDPFTGFGSGTYNSKTCGFICGHRDAAATACPGDLLYAYIGTDFNGGEARIEVNANITTGSGGPSCGITPTPSPTPTPAPLVDCYVFDIVMSKRKSGKTNYGIATVTVKDANGSVVSGATVSGNWTGIISAADSGITGTDGKAAIESPGTKSTGTMTFTVSNITKTGFAYNSSLNIKTNGSITVP